MEVKEKKYLKYSFIILILQCIAVVATCQMKFVHSGALDGKKDLDFIKAKIQNREQPWLKQFEEVKGLAVSSNHAKTFINSRNEDAEISKKDAKRAYANALIWYFTDNDLYAKQAIDILNEWSVLQGFNGGNDQDKLLAGWLGSLFGAAAEIMRGYSGWTIADKRMVQSMFKIAYYPQLNTASTWNGNVDLTQIDAMINMAVFNEDSTELKLAIERFNKRIPSYFYQSTDKKIPSIDGDNGNVDAFWNHPSKWVNGLTQETCRDNGHHAQYALASTLNIAEVAWHQGIDLYTENEKRLTDAMELLAKQVESGDMQGTCKNDTTTNVVFDTWEIGYHHYHGRKGLKLPFTEKVLKNKVRKLGLSDWNIFYETLTHGDMIN